MAKDAPRRERIADTMTFVSRTTAFKHFHDQLGFNFARREGKPQDTTSPIPADCNSGKVICLRAGVAAREKSTLRGTRQARTIGGLNLPCSFSGIESFQHMIEDPDGLVGIQSRLRVETKLTEDL